MQDVDSNETKRSSCIILPGSRRRKLRVGPAVGRPEYLDTRRMTLQHAIPQHPTVQFASIHFNATNFGRLMDEPHQPAKIGTKCFAKAPSCDVSV